MSLPSGSKRSAIAIAFAFCSGAGLLLAQEQPATTISHQVRDVFERAARAVVKIHGVDEHSEICGTGFFVDPTGTLYTAYTVGGEAGRFTVEFDGKKYPATVGLPTTSQDNADIAASDYNVQIAQSAVNADNYNKGTSVSSIASAQASLTSAQVALDNLLKRPEVFVGTLTEKLLTFALGRGVEHYDGPAVREVVRTAGTADYRFSSLIGAIVNSTPFQMRRVKDGNS